MEDGLVDLLEDGHEVDVAAAAARGWWPREYVVV